MKEHYKYYIAMVFTAILFAGAFIAGKLGVSSFSPVVMTFLRMGLASIIIFPYMCYKEGSNWKLDRRELIVSLKFGIIGMTFYHILLFNALKYTTASNASVINASMPIFTAIFAMFILGEKLSLKRSFFILTAFIGVVLTITNWDIGIIFSSNFNHGDLIMLCAAISWSLYSVFVKKDTKDSSSLKLATYSFLVCTIIVSPFALKEIFVDKSLSGIAPSAYGAIAYMSIFPTVIGYTTQQLCIKNIGPSTAALFINLVPVFSIAMATVILGETLNPLNLVSAGIIIISVIAFTKTKEKPVEKTCYEVS